jgi:hypothetical protein
MRKLKFDLKLLPAVLGWLFFILSLSFVLAMLLARPSHAEGLTCVQHKNFLGLRDGWDCKASASTVVLSLHVAPGMVWCSVDGSACKSTGNALLQLDQDALSALGRPHRFEFSMQCVTTPVSDEADCQFDSSGKDSK